MSKKKNIILLIILFTFSVYCALTIGESWDQKDNLLRGKITLDFLFSLGKIDNDIIYREYYSTIYWSLLYFITKIFPHFEIQITNLINLFFSICTIFGLKKLCTELFNDKVAKITFIILFFYPLFFGHMGFNTKDIILAFSHIWIVYLLLIYLKKQNINDKRNKYVYYLAFLAALATGIQLVFLGSLIPVFLFFLLEILLFKKIIDKNFSKKKFLYDIIKCFIIFYLLLVLFWIDVYPNIIFGQVGHIT
jgi:4-amino-4-deoxy-L-arabinose transferase-like glycosyltransferase